MTGRPRLTGALFTPPNSRGLSYTSAPRTSLPASPCVHAIYRCTHIRPSELIRPVRARPAALRSGAIFTVPARVRRSHFESTGRPARRLSREREFTRIYTRPLTRGAPLASLSRSCRQRSPRWIYTASVFTRVTR